MKNASDRSHTFACALIDRLIRDGKIERKRGQGSHGSVHLFRRFGAKRLTVRP